MPNTAYDFSQEQYVFAKRWFDLGQYPEKLRTPQERSKFRDKMSRILYDKTTESLSIRVISSDNKIRSVPIPLNEIEPPDNVKYLKIIPHDKRESVVDQFMDNPSTACYNSRSLHDKIFRAGFTGVTRDYLKEYLKHPKFANYLTGKKSVSTWIKSYRPSNPFEMWQIDHTLIDIVIKDKKRTRGDTQKVEFKYLLVIVDAFSKFVYLYPTQDVTIIRVIEILKRLFMAGDIPKRIHGDQAFMALELQNFCEQWGVRLSGGRSNRPQQQGLVERVNRTIKDGIKKHTVRKQTDNWVGMIPYMQLGLNTTKHDTTKYTPMLLHRGYDPTDRLTNKISQITGSTQKLVEFDFEFVDYKPFDDEEFPNIIKDDDKKMGEHYKYIDRARDNIMKAADKREERLSQRKRNVLGVNSYALIATYLHRDAGGTEKGGCEASAVILGLLIGKDFKQVLEENDLSNYGLLREDQHSKIYRARNPFLLGQSKPGETDKSVKLFSSKSAYKKQYVWFQLGRSKPSRMTSDQTAEWNKINRNIFKVHKQFLSLGKYQLTYRQYNIVDGRAAYIDYLCFIKMTLLTKSRWASLIPSEMLFPLKDFDGAYWPQDTKTTDYDHNIFNLDDYVTIIPPKEEEVVE
jgi:hypothetical protein